MCRRQGLEGSMELRGKDRKVDRCHALGGRRKGASAVLSCPSTYCIGLGK